MPRPACSPRARKRASRLTRRHHQGAAKATSLNLSGAPPRAGSFAPLFRGWGRLELGVGSQMRAPLLSCAHPGFSGPWSPHSTSTRLCQHSPPVSGQDSICPLDLGRSLWRRAARGRGGWVRGHCPHPSGRGRGELGILPHLCGILSERVYPHNHLSASQDSSLSPPLPPSAVSISACFSAYLHLRSHLWGSLSLPFAPSPWVPISLLLHVPICLGITSVSRFLLDPVSLLDAMFYCASLSGPLSLGSCLSLGCV